MRLMLSVPADIERKVRKENVLIWLLESHSFLMAVSISFLSGVLMDMLLKKLTGSDKVRYVAVLAAAVTAILTGVYGMNLHTFVCILFGQVLLFAAEHDIATHTVPDYVPVLILIAGLFEVEFAPALLGLVLVPLPLLAAALIKEGSIGGGDIKLMGACGFMLGVKRGYIALMLGLFLAVMIQAVYAKEGNKGFALVPYLAVGCLLALLV